MDRPVARIAPAEGGRLGVELEREIAERAGLRAGDAVEAFAPGGGVLVLGREGRRDHFAGSLATVSVAELFGFVGTGLRTGVLVIQASGMRRRLVLRDGQVVYASSTDPAERLGATLWRNGMIELDALAQHETRVGPGVRLGRLLTEAGLLTPAQLYRGVQLQVQEIALGAFIETDGEFAFLEGPATDIEAVKLIVRTRDLVLEGISRAERALRWREQYDFAARPSRVPARAAARPEGLETGALFMAFDGQRTLREAAQLSRLSPYAALRALDQLVQSGFVEPVAARPRPTVLSTATGFIGLSALQRYRLAIRLVSEELRASGKLQRLETYFENLSLEHRTALDGIHLDDSGELDVESVQANAERRYGGAMARAVALEALDAFLSFALFDARNVLPAEQATELTRETARILRER